MEGSTPAARAGGIVGVLAATGVAAALMQTVVVPLIGELPVILHTTPSNASWVITVTLLVGAVCMPVVGRLGDLYGKRRMLLVCSVPVVTGSAVCALSSSVLPMIVGRGLQGMGMGIIPLGISAMRDLLPPERMGSAIALMSSSIGIGAALGLPLAAAVSEHASWRLMFAGSAALNTLVAVMIWLRVPATPPHARGRFDLAGALGLGTALVCLLLGVSKGADWGWASGAVLGLLAAAVVVLVAWGAWELRVRDPLVDLRLTARRQVLLTNLASILLGVAMYAQALIAPQLMQMPAATGYGLGQSMLATGLWMAPSGLMMIVISPVSARLSAACGAKVTLVVGSLIIAAGYGCSQVLMWSTWGLLLVSCVCGLGTALAYGAMPALVMSAVPMSKTAAATSFNTLMRSIGTSVSAAVIGVVLSQMTIRLGERVLPSEGGFRVGMAIGGGVALLAAVLALALPARPVRPAALASDGRAAAEPSAEPSAVPPPAASPSAGTSPAGAPSSTSPSTTSAA